MKSSGIMKAPDGHSDRGQVQKVKLYLISVFAQTTQKIVPGPGTYENK